MYSNVRMCKNQNQFGVKKSLVLLQCFHSLVISAIQNGKTKMWLKCRTMNRHFVGFCLLVCLFVFVDQQMYLFLERKWDQKDITSAVVE